MQSRFDSLAWMWNAARAAVRASYSDRWNGSGRRLYLWYRRGALALASDQPIGYELGAPEALPLNLTEDQVTRWIVDRSRRLACLPEEV